MHVLLPGEVALELKAALRDAGDRESGGILMGEHVSEGVFRIKELTVQKRRGTFASFVREVRAALAPLQRFFGETCHDYAQYNYLGEWHSHPSFPVEPSRKDSQTMWRIVEDPAVGANFVVLLIVRLRDGGDLEGSATTYLKGRSKLEATLKVEAVEGAAT